MTPLGTAVFKDTPLNVPPATGQMIIQPNFQILAMGPVPLSLLARLDLFAERQKVDRSAFEYHLSRESVYAAQQMGFTVAEVEQFLTPLPPTDCRRISNGRWPNGRRIMSASSFAAA